MTTWVLIAIAIALVLGIEAIYTRRRRRRSAGGSPAGVVVSDPASRIRAASVSIRRKRGLPVRPTLPPGYVPGQQRAE